MDAHEPAPKSETFLDLLRGFFPGRSEVGRFAGGLVVGAAILGVLTLLGVAMGGHTGLQPTF